MLKSSTDGLATLTQSFAYRSSAIVRSRLLTRRGGLTLSIMRVDSYLHLPTSENTNNLSHGDSRTPVKATASFDSARSALRRTD
jgi:hypothetical protein